MKKGKLPKATHAGELDLAGFKLSCAVLEDRTRIFSEQSLAFAFGIKGGGAVLSEYLSARYLKDFIPAELREKLGSAVDYESLSGIKSRGVDATVLPEICDVYVQVKKAGVKNQNLDVLAENAYVMIKGIAKSGIIALVDEATGYQYDREKNELQAILQAYISKELHAWQKRFPDAFYQEIFRLNKWDFTVDNIRKRPGVVGTWTNKVIYEQLPKGVLNELKRVTPKTSSGKYKARFHQSLTDDIGHPDLQSQIFRVLGIMNISDDWKDLIRNFNKMLARKNVILKLKFDDNESETLKNKEIAVTQNCKREIEDFKNVLIFFTISRPNSPGATIERSSKTPN